MGVISSAKFTFKAAVGTVAARLALTDLLHRGRVLILAYHRVLPGDRLADYAVEPGMYVTDSTFSHHLRFLKAHYDILSMQEWLASWSNGGLHPRGRYCLITFDDGWRDNFQFAFPILRDFRIPATIFLATGFIGTQEWFWTEKVTYLLMRGDPARLASSPLVRTAPAYSPWALVRSLCLGSRRSRSPGERAEDVSLVIERLKEHPPDRLTAFCEALSNQLGIHLPCDRTCLTWEEIEEMSACGIAFGSHSHTHPILTRMPRPLVHKELEESKRVLESRRVNFTPVFCYPNGNFTVEIQQLVQQANYCAAVTTHHGLEALVPADRFAMQRIGIHQDVARTDPLLALRLITALAPNHSHSVLR